MSGPAELLAALREAALPGIWSNGVKLARAEAVALESSSGDERVLRVKASGKPAPYSVVLYPADEAWECNCDGRVDPCEHVVAAGIVLQQAAESPAKLGTTASRWKRVVYHFSKAPDGLRLRRKLAHPDGSETELTESLAAMMGRPSESRELLVEQHDLIVDRLLEREVRGAIPSDRLETLLKVLEAARQVLLEGKPVVVSGEVVTPRAVVTDQGPNVVVTLKRDPRLSEVVSPGVGRCEDALCRLGELDLSGPRLEKLPVERRFSPEQVGELTSRFLPDLGRRVPIEVRSQRIPEIDRKLAPRILLELTQVDGGLSVLPLLVYGAPPHVRVDSGKMVYLRGSVPLRDAIAEQRWVERLRTELELAVGKRMTFRGGDTTRLLDKLQRWDGGVTGDGSGLVGHALRLVAQLEWDDGRARVGFVALGNAKLSADAEAVVRAWREGVGLVPLLEGGWAPLPMRWLEAHGEKLAELLAARDATGRVATHAIPLVAELSDALGQPRPPSFERLAGVLKGAAAGAMLPEPTLPEDLTGVLRPYQRQGVAWLSVMRDAGLGAVLADDMGLGKTLQTLCVLGPGTLVVCPTSVLPNWAQELRRFRPRLRVNAYHGPSRSLDEPADVVLTSYALLRLDAAGLASRRWSTVVLDEAQAIKNPDSQLARAAFSLEADFRIALSGTPLENRLEELWSVLHFTNRGVLGGRGDFDERWTRPILQGSAQTSAALRGRIKPFVLRRLKRDVATDLPPKTEAVLNVELDEHEREVYDTVRAASRADLTALLEHPGSVMKALEALLRLRQAACHPALVPGQTASTSSKVEVLVDSLTTAVAEGHKALVFSQWTSMLDLVEPALRQAEIDFVRLDGSTQDRGAVTAKFQAADGPPVMLISLKAGGAGLNLTAADHVFLLDPWWNPAVEAQAADRAHRIGQDRPVIVYRLVSRNTVEERILALQDKKRELFDVALGGGAAAAGATRDDLLALLA